MYSIGDEMDSKLYTTIAIPRTTLERLEDTIVKPKSNNKKILFLLDEYDKNKR